MMTRTAVVCGFALICAGSVGAQETRVPGPGPYAAGITEMLHRASEGHSPTAEEIAAAGAIAITPDDAAVKEALPEIRKALASPDATMRTYILTSLVGLETPPAAPADAAAAAVAAPAADPNAKPDAAKPETTATVTGPTAYRSGTAAALAPAVPEIAARLTDDLAINRILAATALEGFQPNPPASVYPPLLAYLKRDDGIGPAGLAVVDDLLELAPISDETAAALVRYIRRTDQTADSRSNLVDAIASHANQSQALNKAMLGYLDTDDASVRARLILSLPQLDLAPDVFADTKSRVSVMAVNDGENLQVRNAAKAVTTCWTATRMTSGCPAY